MFYLLIEACYKNGTFKMTQKIYETMERYEILPDNRIRLMHFDHHRQDIIANVKTQKTQKKQKVNNALN
jgi:predicted DNA-binding antitoxin AbrB/MazE fold protein